MIRSATSNNVDIQEYLQLIPAVNRAQHAVWLTYDADTLYVNYKKPSHATDSEMTDEDVIIRYEGDEVIGFTVLHASDSRSRPRLSWCTVSSGSSLTVLSCRFLILAHTCRFLAMPWSTIGNNRVL